MTPEHAVPSRVGQRQATCWSCRYCRAPAPSVTIHLRCLYRLGIREILVFTVAFVRHFKGHVSIERMGLVNMPHISPQTAIQNAERTARNVWNGNAPPPHNCGAPVGDFIYTDQRDALMNGWLNRGTFRRGAQNFDRRASESSGEPKVDLKLAREGVAGHVASVFNYHVPYQPRPKPSPEEVSAETQLKNVRSNLEKEVNRLRDEENQKIGGRKRAPLTLKWIDSPSED